MEPDNTTRDAAMARLEAFIGRIYAMDLSEGVWTLLRDSADFTPLEFAPVVHRHILPGRPADRRPLGVGTGRRDLGA
jgi:hypothetical protein